MNLMVLNSMMFVVKDQIQRAVEFDIYRAVADYDRLTYHEWKQVVRLQVIQKAGENCNPTDYADNNPIPHLCDLSPFAGVRLLYSIATFCGRQSQSPRVFRGISTGRIRKKHWEWLLDSPLTVRGSRRSSLGHLRQLLGQARDIRARAIRAVIIRRPFLG